MTILKRPSYTPGARSARPRLPEFPAFVEPLPPLPHEDPAQVAALLVRARECLARWGDFATRADRMAVLSKQSALTESEWRYLRQIVWATEERAEKRALQAKRALYRPAGDSDLSDAEVTAAIRLLTHHDADHAELANNEGWNSSDSSTGHWCYAMLSTDPAAAIAVARGIVGKYTRQLAMAGII